MFSKIYLLSNTITEIDSTNSEYNSLLKLSMKYRTDKMRQKNTRIDNIRNYSGLIVQDITNQSSNITAVLDDLKIRANKNDIIGMFNLFNYYFLAINQLYTICIISLIFYLIVNLQTS